MDLALDAAQGCTLHPCFVATRSPSRLAKATQLIVSDSERYSAAVKRADKF